MNSSENARTGAGEPASTSSSQSAPPSATDFRFESFVLTTTMECVVALMGPKQAEILNQYIMTKQEDTQRRTDAIAAMHYHYRDLFGEFSFLLFESIIWNLATKLEMKKEIDRRDFFGSLEKLHKAYNSLPAE